MKRVLHFALDMIIFAGIIYFEFSLVVLAVSMLLEKPVRFFIFHVNTVPEADPAVKMMFLILMLLLSAGLAFLAGVEVWILRIRLRQHTKNAQSENHSS